MLYLKADTAVEVVVGPAVAVGDGFTPVTTLSVAAADEAELLKYNGASLVSATSISGTLSAISGADGYYSLDLSTSDTNTEGFLVLAINDDSLILPIRHEFMVVNAVVYDSLFAADGTDYLVTESNMAQTLPGSPTADTVGDAFKQSTYEAAIKKNAAFSNFEFLMIDSTDGQSAKTGLTVTGERSIDGAAFAAVSGTIAEVSDGIYQFDALAADTNGDVITWRFTATGALDSIFTFKTVQ